MSEKDTILWFLPWQLRLEGALEGKQEKEGRRHRSDERKVILSGPLGRWGTISRWAANKGPVYWTEEGFLEAGSPGGSGLVLSIHFYLFIVV